MVESASLEIRKPAYAGFFDDESFDLKLGAFDYIRRIGYCLIFGI